MTVDSIELAAELIRRSSVTPRDEGALDIVANPETGDAGLGRFGEADIHERRR
jgi:hypothetical protein